MGNLRCAAKRVVFQSTVRAQQPLAFGDFDADSEEELQVGMATHALAQNNVDPAQASDKAKEITNTALAQTDKEENNASQDSPPVDVTRTGEEKFVLPFPSQRTG